MFSGWAAGVGYCHARLDVEEAKRLLSGLKCRKHVYLYVSKKD